MVCRSSTPISADCATTTKENAVLTHPMLDQLSQLGLSGMAQAFAELDASDETATLTHADWLGLLVDRKLTHRRDKRLTARLRYARLRQQASVEDFVYRAPRGLDRALFQKLTSGNAKKRKPSGRVRLATVPKLRELNSVGTSRRSE